MLTFDVLMPPCFIESMFIISCFQISVCLFYFYQLLDEYAMSYLKCIWYARLESILILDVLIPYLFRNDRIGPAAQPFPNVSSWRQRAGGLQ